MIVRIVHMHVRPDAVDRFQAIFEKQKAFIADFDGCQHVELLRSEDDPQAFTTYSHWTGADALERYRASHFFRTVWSEVRTLFDERPVARSYQRIHSSQ